jgi:medium-chain acyl-[acyl-carrier-protein] hydrolase
MHDLAENDFIHELQRLNGCPPGVLTNPELLELFLPVLRADFEMDETYIYSPAESLDCPITVFGGTEDHGVSPSDLRAWQAETSGQFSVRTFSGDHFFLQSAKEKVIATVLSEISYVLAREVRDAHA